MGKERIKTKEDLIEALRLCARGRKCRECPLGDVFACKAALMPHWIPVTERLPEDECPVLVTYLGFHDHKPRANMLAYIDRDLGWCWWDDDIPGGVPCSVEITHWQPLPEPPKEE